MRITLNMLKTAGACPKETKRFEKYFGEGGVVTKEKVMLAHKRNFPLWFAASHFLKGKQMKQFRKLESIADKKLHKITGAAYSNLYTAGHEHYNNYNVYSRIRDHAYKVNQAECWLAFWEAGKLPR